MGGEGQGERRESRGKAIAGQTGLGAKVLVATSVPHLVLETSFSSGRPYFSDITTVSGNPWQ